MTLADVFEVAAGRAAQPLVDVVGMGYDELAAMSHAIEANRRRDDAQQAKVMAEMARQSFYGADGHNDVRGWFRAAHKCSAAEATAMRRLSRLGVAAPGVLDELASGRIGAFQAGVLARAFANPRVSDQLLDVLDALFEHAANMQAGEFERVVDAWVRLVDADGSSDARARALDDRSASLGQSDHSFVLRLIGPAIDGEHLRTRLERYIDAEWRLDWARCVAEHGADASPARMIRTNDQRRYDAFMRMLHDPDPISDPTSDAATDDSPDAEIDVEVDVEVVNGDEPLADGTSTCSCGGTRRRAAWPESVTHLMVDIATFERALDRILRPPGDPPGGLFAGDGRPLGRPEDLRRWCSQTTDGRFVPPADIVLEAIFGRVRLVVTDERGVVLHMGRTQRLFTGALRDAVMLAATCCTHPGCLTRASHSQADHLQPHSHGGLTDVNNGGPGCRPHNWKRYQLGLTTVLDQSGYWHTYRADGTEI